MATEGANSRATESAGPGSLSGPELGVSFASQAILGGALVLVGLQWHAVKNYVPTIWAFSCFSGHLFCGATAVVAPARWPPLTKFSRKLWALRNLWYVVFLVGLYAAVLDWAGARFSAQLGVLDANVLLSLARNVMLAAFLAAITSVIAQTFERMHVASDRVDNIFDKTKQAVDKLDDSHGRLVDVDERLSETVHALALQMQTHAVAQQVTLLCDAAERAARAKPSLKPVSDVVEELRGAITLLTEAALDPLIVPGSSAPVRADDMRHFTEQFAEREDYQKHCACIAAAMARHFQAEAEALAVPGVLINITSFVTVHGFSEDLMLLPSGFVYVASA